MGSLVIVIVIVIVIGWGCQAINKMHMKRSFLRDSKQARLGVAMQAIEQGMEAEENAARRRGDSAADVVFVCVCLPNCAFVCVCGCV